MNKHILVKQTLHMKWVHPDLSQDFREGVESWNHVFQRLFNGLQGQVSPNLREREMLFQGANDVIEKVYLINPIRRFCLMEEYEAHQLC